MAKMREIKYDSYFKAVLMCSYSGGNIQHGSKIWQRNTALQIILRCKLFSFYLHRKYIYQSNSENLQRTVFGHLRNIISLSGFCTIHLDKNPRKPYHSCCLRSNHQGYHHYPLHIAGFSQVINNCTYRMIGKSKFIFRLDYQNDFLNHQDKYKIVIIIIKPASNRKDFSSQLLLDT